jgi:hypothetical protein
MIEHLRAGLDATNFPWLLPHWLVMSAIIRCMNLSDSSLSRPSDASGEATIIGVATAMQQIADWLEKQRPKDRSFCGTKGARLF